MSLCEPSCKPIICSPVIDDVILINNESYASNRKLLLAISANHLCPSIDIYLYNR